LIAGFDLPLALLAIGARVRIAGPKGRRTAELGALFKSRLQPGEIVIGIEVDAHAPRASSSFFKFMPRGVLEIPTVNTAASVTVDAAGACAQARVAVGAVSFQPIVLEPAALHGQPIDMKRARDAVCEVAAAAQPLADVRGSIAYKRAMAVEFAARALVAAALRARSR